MIIGTAGHIDHGKTTLVRALTGVDTDRLKEEKARGISIELGYAYTPLSDGNILGFVDVPGHERLVHTMAAGACGIDFALLVIAADDGVMPQTREHVAILQLFGVTRAAVALTKVDCVDPARLRAAKAEISTFLSATRFSEAPIYPVNAVAALAGADYVPKTPAAPHAATTPHAAARRDATASAAAAAEDAQTAHLTCAGLAELRAFLEHAACSLGTRRGRAGVDSAGATQCSADAGVEGMRPETAPALSRPSARLFRLAIDRVFTLAGHGTVVAGTIFSGCVRVGDNIVIFPSNIPVRVRSIHSQNRPAEVGFTGERCALNITGVEKADIERGDWLADARALLPNTRVDARMELLPDTDTVLKAWSIVHFHHGAAHATAHVVPLDTSSIEPGRSHHAQFVFDTPVCALPGDRFIIRDAGATRTIGGGVILDPFAQSRKRRSEQRMRYLRALEALVAGEGITPVLAEAPYGTKESDLVRLASQTLEVVPSEALAVAGARERHIILKSAWHDLRERAVKALREFHEASPAEPGPDIGRLRRMSMPQVPPDLWRSLIADLARDGVIVRSDPWVHLPGHSVTLTASESALAAKLQPLIAEGRFDPPWVRDLAILIKARDDDVRQVLRKQVTRRALYQVVNDLFYDPNCIDELAKMVMTVAQDHGTVEAGQYRDAVGIGRKRVIQILEFFDRVGHTRRFRDSRVVRPDSTWQTA
jgi:selenocysteine-specific elongation factor